MRHRRYLPVVLALALVALTAPGAAAKGRSGPHPNPRSKTLCPAGASTATFTDRSGTGTVAFKTRGACVSFFARDRGVTSVTVTPTTSFSPAAALPPMASGLRLRGNSLAARAVCPVRKTFTLAFTNNALMVNGQAVTMAGQTISIMQLSQSATTVLAGQHTFANHGACVSFFARNKHLFILTIQH